MPVVRSRRPSTEKSEPTKTRSDSRVPGFTVFGDNDQTSDLVQYTSFQYGLSWNSLCIAVYLILPWFMLRSSCSVWSETLKGEGKGMERETERSVTQMGSETLAETWKSPSAPAGNRTLYPQHTLFYLSLSFPSPFDFFLKFALLRIYPTKMLTVVQYFLLLWLGRECVYALSITGPGPFFCSFFSWKMVYDCVFPLAWKSWVSLCMHHLQGWGFEAHARAKILPVGKGSTGQRRYRWQPWLLKERCFLYEIEINGESSSLQAV